MKTATHIVALSPTLRRLLVDIQTWCSADCCQDQAFDVSANAVGRWLDGERIDRTRELYEEVATIENDLPEEDGDVVLDARGLASGWKVTDFRSFWRRFKVAFASAVAARSPADANPVELTGTPRQ